MKGEFAGAKKKIGVDYDTMLPPGTNGIQVTIDAETFLKPNSELKKNTEEAFFKIMLHEGHHGEVQHHQGLHAGAARCHRGHRQAREDGPGRHREPQVRAPRQEHHDGQRLRRRVRRTWPTPSGTLPT